MCRVPQQFAYYRLEVARWTGQSGLASNPSKTGAKLNPMSYDAVKFEGSTAPTGGMVSAVPRKEIVQAATSKADPRRQQDWILRCQRSGRAHLLAACGVATRGCSL